MQKHKKMNYFRGFESSIIQPVYIICYGTSIQNVFSVIIYRRINSTGDIVNGLHNERFHRYNYFKRNEILSKISYLIKRSSRRNIRRHEMC